MYYNYRIDKNQPPYCLHQLQEKIAFRLPRSGCLGTPDALPQSLYGRTDADVRTKIFRINGLPNLLTHGAPRAPLKIAYSARNSVRTPLFCSNSARYPKNFRPFRPYVFYANMEGSLGLTP